MTCLAEVEHPRTHIRHYCALGLAHTIHECHCGYRWTTPETANPEVMYQQPTGKPRRRRSGT